MLRARIVLPKISTENARNDVGTAPNKARCVLRRRLVCTRYVIRLNSIFRERFRAGTLWVQCADDFGVVGGGGADIHAEKGEMLQAEVWLCVNAIDQLPLVLQGQQHYFYLRVRVQDQVLRHHIFTQVRQSRLLRQM